MLTAGFLIIIIVETELQPHLQLRKSRKSWTGTAKPKKLIETYIFRWV